MDFSSENFINYAFRNKSFENPLKPIDRYIKYIKLFVWQVFNLSFSYNCHVNELRNHHLDLSPHRQTSRSPSICPVVLLTDHERIGQSGLALSIVTSPELAKHPQGWEQWRCVFCGTGITQYLLKQWIKGENGSGGILLTLICVVIISIVVGLLFKVEGYEC